jgi:hypothetical protein
MKTFIAYSEAHWMEMLKTPDSITQSFALLAQAQQKAPAGSLYATRIALVADFIQPLLARRDQLLRSADRENARTLRISDRDGSQIQMDGKLDEDVWKKLSGYQQADLPDCTTGVVPRRLKTHMGLFWHGDSLYVGVRCDDPDLRNLHTTGTHKDDPRILDGDHVQLLIETQTHAFYRLAVNSAGQLFDEDQAGGAKPAWASGATVASFVGDGFWSVEIRLPVRGDMQASIDPLDGISGRKPAATYPWYFNVCRQRTRNGVTERYAVSPTANPDFLEPKNFARLDGYAKRTTAWDEEKKKRADAKAASER